jgi:hypothetical protein
MNDKYERSIEDQLPTRRELATKIATIMKEAALRADPMMDAFAIRLNREPTWDEINRAEAYVTAMHRISPLRLKDAT